jgi:uncharacterized membrane protein
VNKNRLEAFSDGVLAIIITIMVLEMKVPRGASLDYLRPLFPVFMSYVLSFAYIGIYWNNHHHMLHTSRNVTGAMLWANLNLLFWLSLFPFATGWMGEYHFAALPSALYGVVLLDGCNGILAAANRDYQGTGQRFPAQKSGRERLEGEAVACHVCCGNRSLYTVT